jgi:hypothetical protein
LVVHYRNRGVRVLGRRVHARAGEERVSARLRAFGNGFDFFGMTGRRKKQRPPYAEARNLSSQLPLGANPEHDALRTRIEDEVGGACTAAGGAHTGTSRSRS